MLVCSLTLRHSIICFLSKQVSLVYKELVYWCGTGREVWCTTVQPLCSAKRHKVVMVLVVPPAPRQGPTANASYIPWRKKQTLWIFLAHKSSGGCEAGLINAIFDKMWIDLSIATSQPEFLPTKEIYWKP